MRTATTIAALTLLSSCSETDALANLDPHQPYSDANVTVIGGDASAPVATGQLTTDGCLRVTTETCVLIAREGAYCKNTGGPADAVLVSGQTAVVVCYATAAQKGETIVVDTDNDGYLDIPHTAIVGPHRCRRTLLVKWTAREILDSRGNPTVEVDAGTDRRFEPV